VNLWGWMVAGAGRVPAGVWMVLALASLVVTVWTLSMARRRMRRAGERAAGSRLVAGGVARGRDTALTVASLIPAALFWAMVLAGALHGLVAFGRSVLGWHGGWEYLVPGTLDGVSMTFAFLAFRAVRMKKAPDRCYRVVWGAAVASATVTFAYEYTHSGHNIIAGGYLALLSLFGMVMLHEFLDQFEEGVGGRRRLGNRPGDADQVGSRLHQGQIPHAVRRLAAFAERRLVLVSRRAPAWSSGAPPTAGAAVSGAVRARPQERATSL
jgi:hypothetical protein